MLYVPLLLVFFLISVSYTHLAREADRTEKRPSCKSVDVIPRSRRKLLDFVRPAELDLSLPIRSRSEILLSTTSRSARWGPANPTENQSVKRVLEIGVI